MTFSTCGFHKSLQWHLRLYSWVQRISSSRLSPLKWAFTCTALFLCVLSSALTLILAISLGNNTDRFPSKLLRTWKTDGDCVIANKMFTVTDFFPILWKFSILETLKIIWALVPLRVSLMCGNTPQRCVSKSMIVMILWGFFFNKFFSKPKIRLKNFVEELSYPLFNTYLYMVINETLSR